MNASKLVCRPPKAQRLGTLPSSSRTKSRTAARIYHHASLPSVQSRNANRAIVQFTVIQRKLNGRQGSENVKEGQGRESITGQHRLEIRPICLNEITWEGNWAKSI